MNNPILPAARTLTAGPLFDRYLTALLAGDRAACRGIVAEAVAAHGGRVTLAGLGWAAMEQVQAMYREHTISPAKLGAATRLNRSLCDRLTGDLDAAPANGRTVTVLCGDGEPEELGGRMAADLFEAEGWSATFAGSDMGNDAILTMLGRERPDLLVIFASRGANLPRVRELIDYLRDSGSCPATQVMCAGGIYKRAAGLAEEIGADLWADDAEEAVTVAELNPDRRASTGQQTVGKMRRVRQQREQERAGELIAA